MLISMIQIDILMVIEYTINLGSISLRFNKRVNQGGGFHSWATVTLRSDRRRLVQLSDEQSTWECEHSQE